MIGALLAADVAVFALQKLASEVQGSTPLAFLWTVARQPALWVAVALGPVQLWLWTRILRRADIGWAYPVTALAYPITMVVASLTFRERYDWHVWAGAGLITAGAVVIGPPRRTGPNCAALDSPSRPCRQPGNVR